MSVNGICRFVTETPKDKGTMSMKKIMLTGGCLIGTFVAAGAEYDSVSLSGAYLVKKENGLYFHRSFMVIVK
jgi:hypothetical protein